MCHKKMKAQTYNGTCVVYWDTGTSNFTDKI